MREREREREFGNLEFKGHGWSSSHDYSRGQGEFGRKKGQNNEFHGIIEFNSQ